ncbi:hypothetical protein [Bifidobacterium aerophilum]|uniref:YcxB family protein n=1 Tax=Bifidobacterium aerophilum TaxID=1798155 RepID=A0A6N9Z2K7_9BIFI|nr:hypothetical protein [Bifidobacterium aerophilum]NEG88721.1 hypothetical protein [Bifidobacterium aerophilum]
MANDIRYRVTVDFNRFKQIYVAQNRAYLRKVGIGGTVVGVLLIIMSIALLTEEFNTQWLLLLAAMILLTVYSVLCIVHPVVFYGSRKNEVYGYFSRHETPTDGRPLNDLSCTFDVTVCQYGSELTMQDGNTVHLPWYALTGASETTDFGTVFIGDDGKNSSLLYNMLGKNAMLREGMDVEPLVVPAEAEHAHPGLTADIARRIADGRARFGKHGTDKQTPAAQELAAWLDADSVQ